MKKILILIALLISVSCSNLKSRYTDEEIVSAVVVDNVFILNQAIAKGYDVDKQNLIRIALKENSLEALKILLENSDVDNKELIFDVMSLEALQLMIRNEYSINVVNAEGVLLINEFINNKPKEFSIELIKKGADINRIDSTNWYPIFWAVNIQNKEIVSELIKRDKTQYFLKDDKGNLPVYYSTSRELMGYLIEFPYNINEKNIYGENILGELYLKAKKLGFLEIQTILIKMGVDPNYKSYGI